MLPPGVMLAGAVLVTATSAEMETVAVVVDVLLAGVGSLFEFEMLTVFTIELPFGAEGSTPRTSINVSVEPVGHVNRPQVISPLPPTAGVVHDQPAGAL